jgi:cysteine desulfurase / selenocysteine lyase
VDAEAYASFVSADTRVATVLHTSPITGMTMDIPAIAAAIRRIAPDCMIIVDGIQYAPHGCIQIEEYGVDAYVVSMYKAFCRFNNGYAWISDRLACLEHDQLLAKTTNTWELGSRDPSAFAGVSEVVTYLQWLGGHFTQTNDPREQLVAAGQVIYAHEHALVDHLLRGRGASKGLCDYKAVRLIGRADDNQRAGLVSFSVDGWDAKDLVQQLGQRGIRVHARSNDAFSGNVLRPLGLSSAVRISVAHYNTEDEVEYCLRAIEEILN